MLVGRNDVFRILQFLPVRSRTALLRMTVKTRVGRTFLLLKFGYMESLAVAITTSTF